MADIPEVPRPAALPDVVSDVAPAHRAALAWVGMENIELALTLAGADGQPRLLPARGHAAVDLPDARHRGIHMSRLYRSLDQHLAAHEPTPPALRALLQEFLDSHAGLATRARIGLAFELPLRRPALKSGLTGWRLYPVRIAAQLDAAGYRCEATVDVQYSSTCPGSAALARQLVQQDFDRAFAGRAPSHDEVRAWLGTPAGIGATPHAQRSLATVTVQWRDGAERSPLGALIDLVEAALGTPVQTAVRREDEQEFARLNGDHPMYCEDAARRLAHALEGFDAASDWRVRAAHLESLHPHDAVASAVKGVPGGYAA